MIFARLKQNLIQILIQKLFKTGSFHVASSDWTIPVQADYDCKPSD
jgi:hypothetical protein